VVVHNGVIASVAELRRQTQLVLTRKSGYLAPGDRRPRQNRNRCTDNGVPLA